MTRFVDVNTGVVLSRDEALAQPDWNNRLRAASFEDHVRNGVPPVTRPDSYRQIAGYVPLPPRTRWRFDRGTFADGAAIEAPWSSCDVTLADIEAVAYRYVGLLNGARVVVELSGGLDSSVVFDVLRSVGANVVLIGFVSERFEFRTERAIQQIFIDGANGPTATVALNEGNALPFTRLDETPLHVVPMVPSLFHAGHAAIASAAASNGAHFVCNGVGGDALFCEDFTGAAALELPFSHHAWGLYEAWPHEHVYAPRGMTYVPSYALWPIPHQIWSLRRGKGEDVQKRYARRLFEGRLPRELTHYAYKSDHSGPFYDGLIAGRDSIATVLSSAWRVNKHEALRPEQVLADVDRAIQLDDGATKRLLSTLSFATWIHSFVREGIV
jgi:hypothetical protein